MTIVDIAERNEGSWVDGRVIHRITTLSHQSIFEKISDLTFAILFLVKLNEEYSKIFEIF